MPLTSALCKIFQQLRNDFNLKAEKSHYFYKSEWELLDTQENYIQGKEESTQNENHKVSLKYLVYRGVYMLLLNSSILGSTICQSYLFHIFLTNWSFTLQNIYALLSFLSVLWRYLTINKAMKTPSVIAKSTSKKSKALDGNLNSLKPETGDKDRPTREELVLQEIDSRRKQSDQVAVDVEGRNISNTEHQTDKHSSQLTILEKAIWILINVVHVLPYCVVLGYWFFVYKPDPDQPPCEKFRSHYIVHGATAFFALLDTLIIAIPTRFFHFLIPTSLLFTYVLFTGLYELAGGSYRDGKDHIYSILDWRNTPKKAWTVAVVGVIVSPLAHTLFCWGTYKLRLLLVSLYKKVSSRNDPSQNS